MIIIIVYFTVFNAEYILFERLNINLIKIKKWQENWHWNTKASKESKSVPLKAKNYLLIFIDNVYPTMFIRQRYLQ